MAAPIDFSHVQAKFVTKQKQYAVADHPISVPAHVGIEELNTLVLQLLNQDESTDKVENVLFDFLLDGEFLRVPLDKHMQQKNISTEAVIEIEYVERHPAPEPEDSLQHDDWVSALHAANDYIVSGSYDNTVRIWNTEGELITTIPGHGGPVKCVAWIENKDDEPMKRFVTGSHDETVLVWQWNQQRNAVECVHSCRGHAGSVDCVAVDPTKSRFCSGSWDRMLKIWSAVPTTDEDASQDDMGEKPPKKKKTDGSKIPTRVPLMTLSGHSEGVSSAQWLDEQEVCTASWDHSIRIWDIVQGAQKSCLTGTKTIFDISYSPLNHLLVAASADRHVRLYDPRITDGAVVRQTFTSHVNWVTCVAWSPTSEHQFISGSYDSLLKLWDTRSPKAPLYDLSGHDDRILTADWSMPQYMLSGGADNNLKIFRYTDKSVKGLHSV